jgi:hypothetical protein
LSPLGPSMVMAGTPLALGVSIYALARSLGRPYALAALVLSGIEALLLASVLVLSLFLY